MLLETQFLIFSFNTSSGASSSNVFIVPHSGHLQSAMNLPVIALIFIISKFSSFPHSLHGVIEDILLVIVLISLFLFCE